MPNLEKYIVQKDWLFDVTSPCFSYSERPIAVHEVLAASAGG